MKRSRSVASAELRRLPILMSVALLALLLAAPSAQAWHGHLKIKKVVVDADSARKASADFDFAVDRQDAPPSGAWSNNIVDVPYLSHGEYWVSSDLDSGGEPGDPWKRFRVTELAAGGANGQPLSSYETSFACETPFRWDGGPNYDYKWSVVVGWGAWPPAGLPQSGAGTQVTTELRWDGVIGGYATLCTFTNKRKPTLKVRKDFKDNPFGESQSVGFTVNGSAVTTAGGSSEFTDGSESEPIPLATDAAAPTISETSGSVDLDDYVKTISCTDASDPGWSYSTQSDAADGSWTLPAPLAAGQDVTCTVTNDRKAARVKVIKYTDPASQQNGFDLYVDSSKQASDVGNGGSTGWVDVDLGSHFARETAAGAAPSETISGWTSRHVCAKNPEGIPTAEDAAAGQAGTQTSATVLEDGDELVCAFHNRKESTPPPPPGGETAGAGAPGQTGAPTVPPVRRGTARIMGTVGCASAKYASATVYGRQIARVTFYVNGRKAKTLTRANAKGGFRLRYRTRSLAVGTYRVRARVEFKAASGTRPRTLSLRFSRCAARSVKPKFTG